MASGSCTISVILPTRKRTNQLALFLDSLVKHCVAVDKVEVVLLVDDDDLESIDFVYNKISCVKIITSRQNMGAYNYIGAQRSTGDVIFLANDDVEVQTHGWDQLVRDVHARFSDRVYLGYPNDQFKGRSLATFPFFSRQVFSHAEEILSVRYRGAFIDYHIMDVFKRLQKKGFGRIVFLENLVFQHRHYRTGLSQIDSTYSERNRFGDDKTFIELANEREVLSQKLADLISHSNYSGKPLVHDQSTPPPFLFLFDRNLPFFWGVRLTSFMVLRMIYQKIFKR